MTQRTPGPSGPAPVDEEDEAAAVASAPSSSTGPAALEAAAEEEAEEEEARSRRGPAARGHRRALQRASSIASRAPTAPSPATSTTPTSCARLRPKGGAVEVSFARDAHASAIKGALDAPPIRDALAHAYGAGVKLVIVPAADGAAPSIAEARDRALAEAQRALEAHAKSHPIVEKAVSLFGGEVRSVRRT